MKIFLFQLSCDVLENLILAGWEVSSSSDLSVTPGFELVTWFLKRSSTPLTEAEVACIAFTEAGKLEIVSSKAQTQVSDVVKAAIAKVTPAQEEDSAKEDLPDVVKETKEETKDGDNKEEETKEETKDEAEQPKAEEEAQTEDEEEKKDESKEDKPEEEKKDEPKEQAEVKDSKADDDAAFEFKADAETNATQSRPRICAI